MSSALKGTEHLNPELQFIGGKAVLINKCTDTQQQVTAAMRGRRLFWRMSRVDGSKCQHVKYCTARSLQHQSSLWCVFCSYDHEAWRAARRATLPHAELQFIVNFLVPYGLDHQCCHQVTSHFWKWPIDFMNFMHNYYIQIDGHCHWHGMHGVTKDVVQERDFAFINAVHQVEATLVRVHHADVNNSTALLAALDAAMAGCCLVLSPSYADAITSCNAIQTSYVMAVQHMLQGVRVAGDCHGNTLFYYS